MDFADVIKVCSLYYGEVILKNTGGLNLIAPVLKCIESFLAAERNVRMEKGLSDVWRTQLISAGFEDGKKGYKPRNVGSLLRVEEAGKHSPLESPKRNEALPTLWF